MKKKYRVIWAESARLDLIDIAEYIAEDSVMIALNVVEKIRKEVAALFSSPSRGRIVPELERHGIAGYREIVIAPWRVLYRIDNDEVHILLVIDGRRNFEDVFFRRLMR